MSISTNIKYIRECHGMSQQQLGEIAGVSDKAVSTWELGYKTPRMGAIEKLSQYFNIPKSKILDDDLTQINIKTRKNQSTQMYNDWSLTSKEVLHIRNYRKLNDLGKKRVEDYINDLSENPNYRYNENDSSTPYIAAHEGDIDSNGKKLSLKTIANLEKQK